MAERVKKTTKKTTYNEAVANSVSSKPTAQEEADKINGYLAQYWANKPKMDKMKANITTLIQKFTIDHPEDSFRIQATFVNFAMIDDKKALEDFWVAHTNKEIPLKTMLVPDHDLMKATLIEDGVPEATWKKQKEPYFAHLKSKPKETTTDD